MNDEERHAAGTPAPLITYESAKLGIWALLGREVLLFGGLFTAYTVFRIKYPEMFHEEHLKLNRGFGAVNTVVLICSSLTVAMAIASIRRGKERLLKLFLSSTIASGAVFMAIKAFEYGEHFAAGEYPATNIFFSL